MTVRLEYRQEKLRSFVQAREMTYPNAKGNHKTEFAVIGDDYFNDGRVISWRCLLIENGRIVAENRSYLVGMNRAPSRAVRNGLTALSFTGPSFRAGRKLITGKQLD